MEKDVIILKYLNQATYFTKLKYTCTVSALQQQIYYMPC
jgi:hypothetical protein